MASPLTSGRGTEPVEPVWREKLSHISPPPEGMKKHHSIEGATPFCCERGVFDQEAREVASVDDVAERELVPFTGVIGF